MRVTLAAAALNLGLCCVPAAALTTPVPYLPVPHDAAVILNTGSTNALGYRIVMQHNGEAEYVSGNFREKARLSDARFKKFVADLAAAMPLSQLHAGGCAKSASFGSSTFVWWRGQRSPDVSCSLEPRAAALNSSAAEIALELRLPRGLMRYLPPHEPRRPMPESTPTK